MSTLISYKRAYFTKQRERRFPGTTRLQGSRETAASARLPSSPSVPATNLVFFLKGLRFITKRAFSELLKLEREYQMLTVTKLLSVDAEPTSEVVKRHESKVTEAFAYIGIALQANRAESLPLVSILFYSILVASLL